MASLYIKDPEAEKLATELAALEGKTKTRAVIDLLRRELANRQPSPYKRNFAEWVEHLHRTVELPPRTGLKADKAFYDSLNDEDEE